MENVGYAKTQLVIGSSSHMVTSASTWPCSIQEASPPPQTLYSFSEDRPFSKTLGVYIVVHTEMSKSFSMSQIPLITKVLWCK